MKGPAERPFERASVLLRQWGHVRGGACASSWSLCGARGCECCGAGCRTGDAGVGGTDPPPPTSAIAFTPGTFFTLRKNVEFIK